MRRRNVARRHQQRRRNLVGELLESRCLLAGLVVADLSVATANGPYDLKQGDEEGATAIVFTVTLSEANNTGSAITFDLDDLLTGTAISGDDYTAIATDAQISVADGASTGTLSVSVIDDLLIEATETVVAQISNSSDPSVTIATDTALATINDNDTAGVTISTANGIGGIVLLDDDLSSFDQFSNVTHSTVSWSTNGTDAIYENGTGSHRASLRSNAIFDFNPDGVAYKSVTLEFTGKLSQSTTGDRLEVGFWDQSEIDYVTSDIENESIAAAVVRHTNEDGTPGLVFDDNAGTDTLAVSMGESLDTHTYKVIFTATGTEMFRDGISLGTTGETLDFSKDYRFNALSQSSTDAEIHHVTITAATEGVALSEAGNVDSYTIALDTVPSGRVEITATADAQTEISTDGINFSSTRVLSFNDTAPKTITVRAIDDAGYEGDHTGTISHAITGTINDPNYPATTVEDLYTQTGTDPTFQELIDSGTLPTGFDSTTGVTGSTIDVNNALVEQGVNGNTPIRQDIRIHTLGNSSIQPTDFDKWTRWYQEDGNTQVFRLYEGEENVRNTRPLAARIESWSPNWPVGVWNDFSATYTIVKPHQMTLFQAFQTGVEWSVHLTMNDQGDISFTHRRVDGSQLNVPLAEDMAGKSFDLLIRENGFDYEVYFNGELKGVGQYDRPDDQFAFRWGMYRGSHVMTHEALVFVTGATISTNTSAPSGLVPYRPATTSLTIDDVAAVIADNDDPSLTVTIDAASVSERDGTGATTATVTRNSDTTDPLTVTILSSDTGEATVPTPITIPAGRATSDPFYIAVINDGVLDGTQTVTITASAAGHDSGMETLDVTEAYAHRISDLTIRVVDEDGIPLPDATVDLTMTDHAYRFGTQVRDRFFTIQQSEFDTLTDTQKQSLLPDLTSIGVPRYTPVWQDVVNYRQAVFDNFNHVVPTNGIQWIPFENGSPTHPDNAINLAQANGLTTTGHSVVWQKDSWPTPTEYRSAANPDPQTFYNSLINDRLSSSGIMSRYSDAGAGPTVTEWDVLNEPLHEDYYVSVFVGAGMYASQTEAMADYFIRANALRPDATLRINDFNILNWGSDAAAIQYRDLVNNLLAAGAPIDCIGVQAHIARTDISKEDIVRRLDILAETGLKIEITEFDTRDDAGQLNQTQQEQIFRDFLEASFEHPAVDGFTMWGFWDPGHWRGNGPLYDQNWNVKIEASPWYELVRGSWMPDLFDLNVDAAGEWTAPHGTFSGTYQITATDAAGSTTLSDVDVTSASEIVVTINANDPPVLDPIGNKSVEEGVELTFTASASDPDTPANELTYSLDTGTPAGANIDSVTGKFTWTPSETQGPGTYNVTVRVTDDGTPNLDDFETIEIVVLPLLDYGDAPTREQSGFANDYPVTRDQNGARHAASTLYLGHVFDKELDGRPDPNADGDDNHVDDDEDGVRIMTSVVAGLESTKASFEVSSTQAGKLDVWIDFNRDGDWDDPNEQLFTNSFDLDAGTNIVPFTIPARASVGDTYVRFRISTAGSLQPTGEANDGEVEDYRVTIVDGTTRPDVVVDLTLGNVLATAENGDLVVRRGDMEVFRAPEDTVSQIQFIGTSSNDEVGLGNIMRESTGAIPIMFDGGDGIDLLRLMDRDQTLDFTSAGPHQIQNLEQVDTIGASPNSLIIDGQGVINATDANNRLVLVHDDDDTINYQGDQWDVLAPIFIDGGQRHILIHDKDTRVEIINEQPFQNPLAATDTNFDEETTALDALQIINYLGRFGGVAAIELPTPTSGSDLPERYYDVNASRTVTALDALLVINMLGRQASTTAPERELAVLSLGTADKFGKDAVIEHNRGELLSDAEHDAALLDVVAATGITAANELPISPAIRDHVGDTEQEENDLLLQLLLDSLRNEYEI